MKKAYGRGNSKGATLGSHFGKVQEDKEEVDLKLVSRKREII